MDATARAGIGRLIGTPPARATRKKIPNFLVRNFFKIPSPPSGNGVSEHQHLVGGARNATLADLERLLPTLAPQTEIVAYCRGPCCIYAHQAVARLRHHGFNARRMQGGLPEWRENGRAVRTASPT
jgi:rhodanese-related sulfurtransferase